MGCKFSIKLEIEEEYFILECPTCSNCDPLGACVYYFINKYPNISIANFELQVKNVCNRIIIYNEVENKNNIYEVYILEERLPISEEYNYKCYRLTSREIEN